MSGHGYGPFVHNNLNATLGCELRAEVILDYAKITTEMRSKLVSAVSDGLLRVRTGQVVTHYRLLAEHYDWPEPHEWCPEARLRATFYLDDARAVEPALLLTFPAEHFNVTIAGWGAKVEAKRFKPGQIPITPTNDLVLDLVRKQDRRPRHEVAEALSIIKAEGSLSTKIVT